MFLIFWCLILFPIQYSFASPVYLPYKPSYSYQIQKLLKKLNVTSESLLNKIYYASVSNNSTKNVEVVSTTVDSQAPSTEYPSSDNYFKLIDLKLYTITAQPTSDSITSPPKFNRNDTSFNTTANKNYTSSNINSAFQGSTTTPDAINLNSTSKSKDSVTSEAEDSLSGEDHVYNDNEQRIPPTKVHDIKTDEHSNKIYMNEESVHTQGFNMKTPTIKVRSTSSKGAVKAPPKNINDDQLECILTPTSEEPLFREGFDNSFLEPTITEVFSSNNSEETDLTTSPPLTDKTFYTLVTDALLMVVSDMVHQRGPLTFQMKPGLEFTVGNLGYITRAGPIELEHPKNGRQKLIKMNIIVGPISLTPGKDVLKPENDFKFYLKGDMEIRIKRNFRKHVVLLLNDLEIGSTDEQIILIKGVKQLATSKTYEMIQDFLYQMNFEGILSRSVLEALKMDSIHKTFVAIPEFLPLL